MINTLSHMPSPSRAAAARPAAPAPAPEPQENPVLDTIDPIGMGQIDSIEKAMQLPIMDPAFQATLALGVAAAALGSAFGLPLGVSVRAELANGDSNNIAQVIASPDHVSVGGLVAGNFFTAGGLELDEENMSATYSERFGNTNVSLTFTADEENEALRVTGNIGTIPANLVYTGAETEDGGAVVNVDGLLGGQEYHVATTLAEIPTQEGDSSLAIYTKGTVGDLLVDKTYTGTVSADQESMTGSLLITGEGQNAGHHQTVNIRADVKPR